MSAFGLVKRKACSFREMKKSKSRPRIINIFRHETSKPSCIDEPVYKGTIVSLDSGYTVESFLTRLEKARNKNHPKKSDKTFSDLNNGCIALVFSNLDSDDLLSMRLVSRRMNDVIASNEFEKKEVGKIQINGDLDGFIYRFYGNNNDIERSEKLSLHPSQVGLPLKFIRSHSLVMDNVVVSKEFVDSLKTAVNDQVIEVVFDFCHFKISACELSSLVNHLKPKFLSIIDSHWRDSFDPNMAFVGDNLMIQNPQLNSFVLASAAIKKCFISDKTPRTLIHSENLPKEWRIIGCNSKVTVDGIMMAIHAYMVAAKKPVHARMQLLPFKWNFGILNFTFEDVCSRLKGLGYPVKYRKLSENSYDLLFRPPKFPILKLELVFADQYPQVDLDEDIPFDDTDDEDI